MPQHHVLVADDEPHIGRIIKMKLEQGPFEVTLVYDGQEAVDALERDHSIDLVLLDLMMPVLDGYGFLEQQRRDPRLAQVPVLVITAGAIDRRRTGGVEVMRKPLDLDRLLAVVAGARGRSGTP